jgi:predicted GIY-YIG superfamily endonuclease
VTFHNTDLPTCVYALVDGRNQEVFYIGISIHLETRFKEHHYDPACASYHRIHDIIADGFECELEIWGEYGERGLALAVESELIEGLPNLVNRARYQRRAAA